MARCITESEFASRIHRVLTSGGYQDIKAVTGPGRSGAIASAYASHILGAAFIPFGQMIPDIGQLLIIDTARSSGATLRRAARKYSNHCPVVLALWEEPPRVKFWYEKEYINDRN